MIVLGPSEINADRFNGLLVENRATGWSYRFFTDAELKHFEYCFERADKINGYFNTES
jgi:hypothetical protein